MMCSFGLMIHLILDYLMSEDTIQEKTVEYLRWQYPKVKYCASLGGIRTGYKQAVKAKRTGYVKGFPDMQLLEARGGYFGMFIEIKTHKGYPTSHQKEWIEALNDRGYYAIVAKGLPMILDEIDSYLSKDKTQFGYDFKDCLCK